MHIPDPVGQHRHLVKHFFWRFFDLEAISTPQADSVQKNALKIRILASLVAPGVLGCLLLCPKYAFLKYWRPPIEFQQAVMADKIFFLSISMILLGFIAVYEWETLLPDLKDYLILTHLPIRIRTIFSAKTTALVLFLLTFFAAVNAGPTVFLPSAILVDHAPLLLLLRYIACHALSFLLANIFIFFAVIALQGILLALLPARAALSISRKIRFVCFMLLLFALFSFSGVRTIDQSVRGVGPIAPFHPPLWFVGVYDVLLGSRNPAMLALAGRAAIALTLTGALCVLAYALCYRRFMRSSLETAPDALRKQGRRLPIGNFLMNRCFIGKPEDRATFHFLGQTLFRSSQHVLYLGIFLAIGISVAVMVLAGALHITNPAGIERRDELLLLAPRLLAFILLAGMKVSFTVPVDLEANWLFRLSPEQRIKRQLRACRMFLICVFLFPLFMVSGLSYLFIWDWPKVLWHSCYGAALALIVMELFLRGFAKIPFTCSYLPGGAQRILYWPIYMLGFFAYLLAATKLETLLMEDSHGLSIFYAIITIVYLALLSRNLLAAKGNLSFEEESPDDPVYLNMHS